MGIRDEQETTVTVGRNDEWVQVWTSNPVHARKLEKDTRAIRVSENSEGIGGTYRIRASDFNIISFRTRRKPMTEEQRQAATERLRAAREAQ